jgi:RNA polymerase sigma-70 factor (ECF subfamily)
MSDACCGDGRVITYCVIPRELAPRLHELLLRHFREQPAVQVVVERRSSDRRRGGERRGVSGEPGAADRRRIPALAGRRVSDRRVLLLDRPAPALPRRARAYADRLRFVERLEPSHQEAEDADTGRLVIAIHAGDRDAFAILYMRYFQRVYGYLRLLFGARETAEDATQQVFVQVLDSLPSFQHRGHSFRAWLFTIARNVAYSELRRAARSQPVEIVPAPEHEEPAGHPETLDNLRWISDPDLQMFIRRLPLAQRQVLFLRYVVGLGTEEIGAILGHSADSVWQLHSRAMKQLRQRLDAVHYRRVPTERPIAVRRLRRTAPVLRARRFGLLVRG